MSELSVKNIDVLAQWVESIKFDAEKGRWIARFFPGKIIEVFHFNDIISELVSHAAEEIIYLVADSLGIAPDKMVKVTGHKSPHNLADARMVAAIVLVHKLPGVSYRAIGEKLGWTNHSMVHHSLKNRDVTEVDQKLEKVYSRYPFLNGIEKPVKNK